MAQTPHALAPQVRELCRRIGPMFHGHPPEVVGAALADLLATLLGGHYSADPDMTDEQLREEMLAHHMDIVRRLIPVNEGIRLRQGQRH